MTSIGREIRAQGHIKGSISMYIKNIVFRDISLLAKKGKTMCPCALAYLKALWILRKSQGTFRAHLGHIDNFTKKIVVINKISKFAKGLSEAST
jgi:hypothetical protein